MRALAAAVMGWGPLLESFIIWYFLTLNGLYVLLSLLAHREVYRHLLRSIYGGYERLSRSPLTPAISVIVPAHNEEVSIALTVNNLLHLDYMRYEVIVVDDGSTDGTFAALKDAYKLVRADAAPEGRLAHKPVRAVWRSERHHNLLVVEKVNGGKADALNAGIDHAKHPYFCSIDADVILEADALQRVIQPVMESGRRVIAVGGIIRVANGCLVEKGRVLEVGMSTSALVIFQIVEYFRAFLCGRTAFSRLDSLLIISGAFGLFERELAVSIGGYRVDTVGEDMDLVMRLHVHMRENRLGDYSVQFVPDPMCWTEVPDSIRVLARQRRRWQRGLLEVLAANQKVFLDPAYGVIGLFAYPFFLVFEGWGVLLEATGYLLFALFWLRGGVNSDFALAFLFAAFLCGTALSLCGVLLGEMSPRAYPKLRHLAVMLVFAVADNVLYRPLTAGLRLLGVWDYLKGTRGGWGRMERQGLQRRGAMS